MLPGWWIREGCSQEVDKGTHAIAQMPSALVDHQNRILLVGLMFGKELDQMPLGQVIGHLHFAQADDSKTRSSQLDEH